MPISYKVLGQVAPFATTNTTLYTAPATTETVISTIAVCNRAASTTTFRIAVRPNGATLANEHYIAYDSSISANDTLFITVGATIDAADVVTVYAATANMSFTAFGSESTP